MTMRGPEDPLIDASTPPEWRERKAELTAGLDPYAIKALGTELFTGAAGSVEARLVEIRVPTTVIVGSEDHPFVDHAPAMSSGISDSTLVVIGGAYHSPQLTHADEWRRAVLNHVVACD